MGRSATLILGFLLGIGIFPLFGAIPTDQELIKNLALADYTCEFSNFTKVPMLFVNYNIKNSNEVTLYELSLHYQVSYQDVSGSDTPSEGEATVTPILMNWTTRNRLLVTTLPGEKSNYKITSCKAAITGFYREVPVAKKRTVTVKTGEKLNVAPDCREDYAKLQTMKPGVDRREFASKLVRLGCVTTEPIYGKKTESYEEKELWWVDYKQ